MKSYSAKSVGAFGKKVAVGAKKAVGAANRTGRRVVRDNPEIAAGAKVMASGAKDMGKGVAKGLSKEAQRAYSEAMAKRTAAKADKQ